METDAWSFCFMDHWSFVLQGPSKIDFDDRVGLLKNVYSALKGIVQPTPSLKESTLWIMQHWKWFFTISVLPDFYSEKFLPNNYRVACLINHIFKTQ